MIPLFMATLVALTTPEAYHRFDGNWTCSSTAGSTVTMAFSENAKGELTMETRWRNGIHHGTFSAFYRRSDDGSWAVHQDDDRNLMHFEGRSPGFVSDALDFTGYEGNASGAVFKRETFRFISDRDFQHVWYLPDGRGGWRVSSFAECSKVSP
jgi:hypothetical protein